VIAYLDTSALVKLVLDDEGTPEATEIWNVATVRLASALAYAECRAALAAARRGRRLTVAQARTARSLLDERWAELAVVALDEPLGRSAGDLADTLAPRGADAVHLASALAAADGGVVVVVTWDRYLGSAALRSGLPVSPAHEEPEPRGYRSREGRDARDQDRVGASEPRRTLASATYERARSASAVEPLRS
jgi:hypothetical protein